ncbi:MAG: DNA polymerase III subunit epsilon [Burkholderiaceae bacterium]
MRQIILDTETTGLDPAHGHRVVELACVEMVNRSLTGNHLHLYLNPDRDSDPEALAVHGLTTEFLSGHPRFEEVVQQFVDFIRGGELIIHNAAFDCRFLNAELQRVGLPRVEELCEKITDSLLFARELHPGRRNSLDALCERYGISNAHRTLHGALLDSELLADVWLAMTRGQDALLMDFEDDASDVSKSGSLGQGRVDTSVLRVVSATEAELAEHQSYLDLLDKSVKGECVWRAYEPAAAMAEASSD